MHICLFHTKKISHLSNARLFSAIPLSASECYSALGIGPGANEEKIKSAYRRLAKIHHPDLGGRAEMFVRIQKAYDRLMDGDVSGEFASHTESSTKRSQTTSSSSSHWKAWDTDSTWWSSGKYNSNEDFDAEFETQWRKYTAQRREARQRKKSSRFAGYHDEESAGDSSKTNGFEEQTTRGRKSGRSTSPRSTGPTAVESVSLNITPETRRVPKSEKSLWGVFIRMSRFNGKPCYWNKDSGMFLFFSGKSKEWKISNQLKDEEKNSLAFADRVGVSEEVPFTVGSCSKWMQWCERSKRFLSVKIRAEAGDGTENAECKDPTSEYLQWSIDKLRKELLKINGLQDQVNACFDKQELVALAELYLRSKPESNDHRFRNFSNNAFIKKVADIPQDHYFVCSRQRHDGVTQQPPLLSEQCTVHKNRVENFCGPVNILEEWILRHGDRKRMYGVYDREKRFCFCLGWKDHTHWGRLLKYDF